MTTPQSPIGDAEIDARWATILNAATSVQAVLPGTLMIGGSAIAVHTGHRLSGDVDMVRRNLDRDWHDVRAELEELSSWTTDYPKIPVNLTGRFDGARVSIRKLNRIRDIEISTFDHEGRALVVASQDELVRMKLLAILSRNLTRDYVDLVALDAGLREIGTSAVSALTSLDDYYAPARGDSSLTREVLAALADPQPREADPQSALDELVDLRSSLSEWPQLQVACQRIVAEVS